MAVVLIAYVERCEMSEPARNSRRIPKAHRPFAKTSGACPTSIRGHPTQALDVRLVFVDPGDVSQLGCVRACSIRYSHSFRARFKLRPNFASTCCRVARRCFSKYVLTRRTPLHRSSRHQHRKEGVAPGLCTRLRSICAWLFGWWRGRRERRRLLPPVSPGDFV